MCEFKENTEAQVFLRTLTIARTSYLAHNTRPSSRGVVRVSGSAVGALAHRGVKRLKSGHCFFRGVVVLGMVVHLDSRCTQQLSHLTTLGGQHGKKAKKRKEARAQ